MLRRCCGSTTAICAVRQESASTVMIHHDCILTLCRFASLDGRGSWRLWASSALQLRPASRDVLQAAAGQCAGSPGQARADSGIYRVSEFVGDNGVGCSLTLADGRSITARCRESRGHRSAGCADMDRHLRRLAGQLLVLSKAKASLTGSRATAGPDAGTRARPGRQAPVLFTVDTARGCRRATASNRVERAAGWRLSTGDVDQRTRAARPPPPGAVVQDVLVVYTAAAATKWG